MNHNERFDRLDHFIAEGRLVRKTWGDGQERACLLLALAPEVGENGRVERCPTALIPAWLAYLTPKIDDCGTEAAWPATVRRYAVVVRAGAQHLDALGWRRALARTTIAILGIAGVHDTSGSCARVAALWGRVLVGDEPGEGEWAAAARAAAARVPVARPAREAEWVAQAAEWVAGAGWAAGWWMVEEAAREATWDRITAAILDGIEEESAEK